MDLRFLTRLILKITGAAILVWTVAGSAGAVLNFFTLRNQGVSLAAAVVGTLVPLALPIVLGLSLVFFPGHISNAFVRGDESTASARDALWKVEGIAYSFLGLYLLVNGLADAGYHYGKLKLYAKMFPQHSYTPAPPLTPEDLGRIVATGVEILLGIALILSAPGLVKVFRKVRAR